MAVGRISKRAVEALQPGERDLFLWDDALSGFGVKVTPKGKRVYLAQYRTGGRRTPTRRVTIGRHGVLTADKARDRAANILARVELGDDPAAEHADARNEMTVAELADRYVKEWVKVRNKPSTAAEVERLVDKLIKPKLGAYRLSELTSDKVADWHKENLPRPISANRALAALSKMMALAVHPWRKAKANPCKGVEKFTETERRRFYSDEELKRIGEAIAASRAGNTELPGVLDAITFLALTGLRMGELLALRWDEVDGEQGVLRLPDAKAGARTVAVGAAARLILEDLPRDGDYVIRGAKAGEPLKGNTLEWAWSRLRREAKIKDGRLHDFRHTAATYAAQGGFNAFIVRDLLGHKTMAMSGRYVERTAAPVRKAADNVAERVASAFAGKPKGKVVKMPKRKAV